ncbi:glutaconate CoA-transferase [Myxococcota bacterium]|nr:glutaconate CoA-transferase [Myxococcota bacterium]
MSLWREVVSNKVQHLEEGGADKRMGLAEAVRRFVRPGMKINPVSLQSRPVAALAELIRQFSDREAGFEFISSSLSGNYLQLVGAGLLRRAIVSFAGEGYPTPGPSPVVARALERGDFELENWTMLTISQRLLAGAMGVPFLTTRSIQGSDMAEELERAGAYAEVEDPFEPGRQQGVVRAYRPDLSFVHAWAADASGNAICFPPYQENVYGALAASEGVILTVHRVVSRSFVRRHSQLVRIPAERVVAVCEVPYGSHPYGNYATGVPEFIPYANDYPFMREHRAAQDRPEDYEAWLSKWILELPDHDAYLANLGSERMEALEHLAGPETWRDELEYHAESLDALGEANATEEMIVQAARVVGERVREAGHTTVLSGVGQAALTAWLASHRLREEGVEFTNLAETGMVGHDPRPADPFLVNYRNLPTTTLLTDVMEALGLYACGGANRCLATLGAGQIDRCGNVNSSWNADGSFIVGSGGANDLANAARETVIVARQRAQTFVEKVDFVTSHGERVSRVISHMGIYERQDGELVLTAVFEGVAEDLESAVDLIRAHCGWALRVSPAVEIRPSASAEELALLRVFAPERSFLGRAR